MTDIAVINLDMILPVGIAEETLEADIYVTTRLIQCSENAV